MGRSAIHDRLLARNVIHRFHPAMFRICQSRLNVVVSFLGVQSAQGLRVGRPEHRLSAPVHRHGHPPEGHLPPGHGRAPLPGQFAQTALGPGQSADASAASTVQSSVVHHSAAFRQTRRQGNPFHPVISTPPLSFLPPNLRKESLPVPSSLKEFQIPTRGLRKLSRIVPNRNFTGSWTFLLSGGHTSNTSVSLMFPLSEPMGSHK